MEKPPTNQNYSNIFYINDKKYLKYLKCYTMLIEKVKGKEGDPITA